MLPTKRPPTHPGEILSEEFLKPLGLTQGRLAEGLKIPLNRLNEIINGKRGVTPDTALRLAAYFGTSPEFWMNLQDALDLWNAKQEIGGAEKAIAREGEALRAAHG